MIKVRKKKKTFKQKIIKTAIFLQRKTIYKLKYNIYTSYDIFLNSVILKRMKKPLRFLHDNEYLKVNKNSSQNTLIINEFKMESP